MDYNCGPPRLSSILLPAQSLLDFFFPCQVIRKALDLRLHRPGSSGYRAPCCPLLVVQDLSKKHIFFLLIKCTRLSYIPTIVPPSSSLPIPTSPPAPQSTPSLFVFRNRQVSHGYQQSMTYRMGLSASPCIKVRQGNPV